MVLNTHQIPLNLYPKISMNGEDFFVSESNEHLIHFIQIWPSLKEKIALLIGPNASGKTHFGRIWQTYHNAKLIDLSATSLTEKDIIHFDSPLLLDNIHDSQHNPAQQEVLFHLYNKAKANQLELFMLSSQAATYWEKPILPDLLTRLNSCMHLEIKMPDDLLIKALIMKHFADRQLYITPDIIDYIPKMIERSFQAVQNLVEQIDKIALSTKRKITMPLVREIILMNKT